MGYMRTVDILPELRDEVMAASPGEVLPEPIRTRMGVHVVRVRAGEDMDSLAAHYTQRVWAREKAGRFGPLTERSAGYSR